MTLILLSRRWSFSPLIMIVRKRALHCLLIKCDTLLQPLSTEVDLYEAAAGAKIDGGLGNDAICGSYHWGKQCFVDEGRFRTGCLSHQEFPYDEVPNFFFVVFLPLHTPQKKSEVTHSSLSVSHARFPRTYPALLLTSQDFHTYAVEWNPSGYIQWYYDGRVIFTVNRESDPAAPLPPPDPMIIVLNTALAVSA